MTSIFTGLSAFPLTPTSETGVDEASFVGLIERLAAAGVDSIGALGSTGGYAYLTREQRSRAASVAVGAAGDTPVIVGIGALRTAQVLRMAEDAQNAGVAGVLLAPVSYQPLTSDEVFGLFETVTAELSVPLCVYDNPGTTHFTFTDDLYESIAALPHVASIKIPGIPGGPDAARSRVDALRTRLPRHVTLGISFDPLSTDGLNGGCDAWYSVLGGLFPAPALAITRAVRAGDASRASDLSAELEPLWELYRRFGSLRVMSALAEHLGLVGSPNLPLPLRSLDGDARDEVIATCSALGLLD